MASSLLDRSLDDLAKQRQDSRAGGGAGRGGGRGRGAGSGRLASGGRSSPYSRPPPRADPDGTWQHDLFQTNKLDYGGDDNDSGASKSRRSRYNDDDGPRSTRLKITNLHYEVSERELEALFVQIGPLAPGTERESNPAIKFDNSGRSLGEASVTYESEADAARAKDVFHDALAKGERISIEYDFTTPRRPRREKEGLSWGTASSSKGGAGANSLLARLDGSGDVLKAGQPQFASSIGRAAGRQDRRDTDARSTHQRGRDTSGRGRGADSARGSAGSGGRGRGSTAGGRGGGAGGRDNRSREAKTAEDLDRELEEFMSKGSADKATTEAEANKEDIDMA